MKLLGTGLSGLVGSRIVELLSSRYSFEDISRKTGTDITNETSVKTRVNASDCPFLFHFAGDIDVELAEKEKHLGEKSRAWQINVLGTKNIIAACEATGKRLIHISTDMVFPGDKQLPNRYKEEDVRGPVNWYATTKYEAEKLVEQSKIPWTILRIAYPYRAQYAKNDSVRIFLSKLQAKEPIRAVVDHYFTPTFIDDLAPVIEMLVKEPVSGIFHTTGEQVVSPYDIAIAVAQLFHLDTSLISRTTRTKFFSGRATRPFNLSLSNDKITKLGIKMKSLEEGLKEMQSQITHI